MYEKYIKRLLDLVFSLLGIIILAIPMLLIALIIRLEESVTPLFRQKRIKKGKQTFTILKFRSMIPETPDVPAHLLQNPQQYTTKTGAVLRRLSIDELPQLFNIFQGSMSFIGPRPANWNEYELIEERDKYGANDVKPGLTGWAQINGRNKIDVPTKAKYDAEYVKQLHKGHFCGFLMDCRCIVGTVKLLLSDWR